MTNQTDLAHLAPNHSDEIDLGELIRNIFSEWKTIVAITALGAIAGVAAALLIPKQYRVEAILDRPSISDIQALLAQDLIPLTREDVINELLKNLTSRNLVEQALKNTDLLVDKEGSPLSLEQRVTAVSNAANSLRIAPAEYDFIELDEDAQRTFDQISFSSLSSKPSETQRWMNELLSLAEQRTISTYSADLKGQTSVEIGRLEQQLEKLLVTAQAEHEQQIIEYQQAIAIATELGFESQQPASALAYSLGSTNEQMTTSIVEPDLYLKGTKILNAELATLKNSQPKPHTISIGFDEFGNSINLSPAIVSGNISALKSLKFDLSTVDLVPSSVQAVIPAVAEKPNRKLIVIAATVLAGFFSLFVVLIKLALKNKAPN